MQKIQLKFLLLYKAFHALLVCLFYHTLYIKFMIQQIWCFRLWRKSGVTEIRPLLLLQRWYIDLKLLYDRSAVLSNSHTSLASNMCCKTKKNVMKFMFTVLIVPYHTILFFVFSQTYISLQFMRMHEKIVKKFHCYVLLQLLHFSTPEYIKLFPAINWIASRLYNFWIGSG